MKLSARLLPLLALPLLAVACSTTKTVPIEFTLAPDTLIEGHPGVALLPTQLYDAADDRAQRAAGVIESRVRKALSHEANSFRLVDAGMTDQVVGIINKSGDNWDDLSTETIDAIQETFGNQTAPTAFFYARLVDLEDWSDLGQTAVVNWVGIEAKGTKTVNQRSGGVAVRLGFTFYDGKTGEVIAEDFLGEGTAEPTVSNDDQSEPPPLNYRPAFDAALDQIARQFEEKWAFSTRKHAIPVFIGDGNMHFFLFEDKEYPLLATGLQRMTNQQFDKAEGVYLEQVEALRDGDQEMLARATYNLAVAIEAQGRLGEALELYGQAEDLSTNAVIARGKDRCEERIETEKAIGAGSETPEA